MTISSTGFVGEHSEKLNLKTGDSFSKCNNKCIMGNFPYTCLGCCNKLLNEGKLK